jgi:pyruvate ferredoxin oxidoreductase delta subunit
VRIDYDYCKGCGICESVCPVKAIRMAEEASD